MDYLIKRTVIAARRLEAGAVVAAENIGEESQIERLVGLGAIEAVGGVSPDPDLPGMDDALRAAMIEVMNKLPADGFTSSGKPSVEALEAALPDYADRIDAALRDAVWEERKAAADAAT